MNKKSESQSVSNNFLHLPKSERIKTLLQHAKQCYNEGRKPTKREIRKKFRVEIYNYFENIADYHRAAAIPISIRHYSKKKARQIVAQYVHNRISNGHYPNRKEIEKYLQIHISTYFKNLKDLYEYANVDYSRVKKAIENKIIDAHTHDKKTLDKQRQIIKKYIRSNVSKNFYPSVQHIQKELNLSFYNLYDHIYEAYEDADVIYDRPSSVILGKKKELLFTHIVKELLTSMGYMIRRVSIESKNNFNREADLTVENKQKRTYLVELKAYQGDRNISKREFLQLFNYMNKSKVNKGIFITTSNTQKCDFENIIYVNSSKLIKLLKEHGLDHYLKIIQWIQTSNVSSVERKMYKESLKRKLVAYVQIKGTIPTKKEIQKALRIDIRTIYGNRNPYQKLLQDMKHHVPSLQEFKYST